MAIVVGNNNLIFGILFGMLAIGISSNQLVFADPGEDESGNFAPLDIATFRGLDPVEPDPNVGATFFGNGGYSADGTSSGIGPLLAEVPPGSTVEQAYLYASSFAFGSPILTSVVVNFDGTQYTLDQMTNSSYDGCCDLRSFKHTSPGLVNQVKTKIGGGSDTPFSFPVAEITSPNNVDGVALVVIFSNPAFPENSIAILDGGLATAGDQTIVGLSEPLNKTVDGFEATLSLGIGFSAQLSALKGCGTGQASQVDINGQRLTSCAGGNDDGARANGKLFTVGGVGDDTNNPPNPNGSGGEDDELYDISGFLSQGDTQIQIDTRNSSGDDIVFLAIIQITARASVGEICGDGIDNDDDGLIDEGCGVEGLACTKFDFNDSDDGELPPDWSGAGSLESVREYTTVGFDGDFLRNTSPLQSPNAAKTTLTLDNLPAHSTIDIGFLLAIIATWDGDTPCCNPDFFNVVVDGIEIFKETFGHEGKVQSYVPPNDDVELAKHVNLGFSSRDHAYNMGKDPTFQNIPHTDSSVTIDFFAGGEGWQGGGDESWAIENVAIGLDNGCAVPETEPETTGGGDNQWDTRPSFGISHETRQDQIVENGFSFNSEYFTLTDNHWTDFPEQSVDIGTINSFSATVWADKGLKIQEFLFGIPNVGESHLAEVGVEIWYDINGEIEDVVVVQNSHVIDADTITVSHEMTKCLSTEEEANCDTTTVSMVFMEPLMDKVMAIKAIDWKNRDQRTYLNDGFDISGESLNPMLAKMIPSSIRDEGLLKVTQVAKYSPYWVTDDHRIFEMNSFGSFKQINQSFERFQDAGTAYTRMHSGFGGIIAYEQDRALEIFDSSSLVSELPASFVYIFPVTGERINEEMRQAMLLQEQIAEKVLAEMDKQQRNY